MLGIRRSVNKPLKTCFGQISRAGSSGSYAVDRTKYKNQLTEMRKSWLDEFARRKELKAIKDREERRLIVENKAVNMRVRRIQTEANIAEHMKWVAKDQLRKRTYQAKQHFRYDQLCENQNERFRRVADDLTVESKTWITRENMHSKITADLFSDKVPTTTGIATKYSNHWRYHVESSDYQMEVNFRPEQFTLQKSRREMEEQRIAEQKFHHRESVEEFLSGMVGSGEELLKLKDLVDDMVGESFENVGGFRDDSQKNHDLNDRMVKRSNDMAWRLAGHSMSEIDVHDGDTDSDLEYDSEDDAVMSESKSESYSTEANKKRFRKWLADRSMKSASNESSESESDENDTMSEKARELVASLDEDRVCEWLTLQHEYELRIESVREWLAHELKGARWSGWLLSELKTRAVDDLEKDLRSAGEDVDEYEAPSREELMDDILEILTRKVDGKLNEIQRIKIASISSYGDDEEEEQDGGSDSDSDLEDGAVSDGGDSDGEVARKIKFNGRTQTELVNQTDEDYERERVWKKHAKAKALHNGMGAYRVNGQKYYISEEELLQYEEALKMEAISAGESHYIYGKKKHFISEEDKQAGEKRMDEEHRAAKQEAFFNGEDSYELYGEEYAIDPEEIAQTREMLIAKQAALEAGQDSFVFQGETYQLDAEDHEMHATEAALEARHTALATGQAGFTFKGETHEFTVEEKQEFQEAEAWVERQLEKKEAKFSEKLAWLVAKGELTEAEMQSELEDFEQERDLHRMRLRRELEERNDAVLNKKEQKQFHF